MCLTLTNISNCISHVEFAEHREEVVANYREDVLPMDIKAKLSRGFEDHSDREETEHQPEDADYCHIWQHVSLHLAKENEKNNHNKRVTNLEGTLEVLDLYFSSTGIFHSCASSYFVSNRKYIFIYPFSAFRDTQDNSFHGFVCFQW